VRPLRLVVLLLAFAGVVAPQALARPLGPSGTDCAGFEGRMESVHFVVHWTGYPKCTGETITEPQAGDILGFAERAYTEFVTSWGFKPPVSDAATPPTGDADGKVDLYVYKTKDAFDNEVSAIYGTDEPAAPQVGWAAINNSLALEPENVMAGVFHTLSLAYDDNFQEWLMFGSAEWAALRSLGWPSFASLLDSPDISLDCYGYPCDDEIFFYNGPARWPFYVYLQDRFGVNAVRGVWEELDANDPAGNGGVAALGDYLAGKGTTLPDVFNDFAGAVAAGNLSALSLKGKLPTAHATITAGAAATTLPPLTVAVNHLAARFVEIVPGSEKSGVCHPATLTVVVDVPSGTAAKPKWFFSGPAGTLASFSVAGSKATYSAAWDTCKWKDERRAIVTLPNASTMLNGAEFKVTATLSAINTSVILSPDAPVTLPDPRPVVPTPNAAPVLSLHAPSVIHVGRSRTLSLHVYASHEGLVRLGLDGRGLGSVAVRAGQNVFRLKIPQLKALRRRGVERSSLSLTALSESGRAGGTISRRLVFKR
jgi:hypothetical protein